MSMSLSLSLALGQTGAASAAGPVNGDPIAFTMLSSTPIVTTPTNNIDPSATMAFALTFKGTSIGGTFDWTKVLVAVSEPGFDASFNPILVTRTLAATHFLRMPAYPQWVTATAYVVGQRICNKLGGNDSTAEYQCLTKGAGTSTVAPTNTSGTSGLLADGYNWTFLSNTNQSDGPPSTPIEQQSGPDAVIYGVLEDYVSSAATMISVTVAAGAYTGSRASNPALMTLTNNSTWTPFKPHAMAVSPNWTLVGNTLHWEVYADHPYPIQGVKVTVYDNTLTTPVSTGLTGTATSWTQSANAPNDASKGGAGFLFQGDIDVSSLADSTTSVWQWTHEVFPSIGAKYASLSDGFRSATYTTAGQWTAASKTTLNQGKSVPFQKHASPTIQWAAVDGVGGAPSVQTSEANALLHPYASVSAAATALQTANGAKLDAFTICVIKDGVTLSGLGGDLNGRTYGIGAFRIQRQTSGVSTTTIAGKDADTTAFRHMPVRATWQDLLFAATATNPVLDGQTGAGTNDFTIESSFTRCSFTTAGSANCVTRYGVADLFGCISTGASFVTGSSTNSMVRLVAGSKLDGSSIPFVHLFGVNLVNNASSSGASPSKWNENSQLLDCPIYAFTSWMALTLNTALAFNTQLTTGGSVCNFIAEAIGGSAKQGVFSGDGVQTPCGRLYLIHGGSMGGGLNFCYNEQTASGRVFKSGILIGWLTTDLNMKGDLCDNFNASQPSRTGNWGPRYRGGHKYNLIWNPTNGRPGSPSSYVGEIGAATDVYNVSKPAFVNDASRDGTSLGNGDYRIVGTPALTIPAAQLVIPVDRDGTTRKTDGTASPGPFEHT